MKLNRFIALAAIALLVVGAMGVIATHSFAKGASAPVAQSQDCSQDQADGAEVQDAPDTDNVELQCGDQNEPDEQESVGEAESAETAPTGTPAITAEQAQTAALAVHSGTVLKTELDDENGQLVYSVEFDGGVDVKVDAMTGSVLSTETGQD
jgi:uncharacterized membrane protein YkoI